MAEQTYSSLSTSSVKRQSEDNDCLADFDSHSYLCSLNNELNRETKRSNLEILLLLNYCVTNFSSRQCRCFLEQDSSERLKQDFTLIKDILAHLLDKVSEASVQGLNSDCKSEYELDLILLFSNSLNNVCTKILTLCSSTVYKNKLKTTIKQIDLCVKILIVRYVWQCRKKFVHYSKSRADSSRSQVRSHFFQEYEANANLGRFPHIYWQATDLSQKISQHDSLEEIFSQGNEEKCCVCLKGGEYFQNDFAIFLHCNHLLCVTCAEQLLVNNIKYR